MVTTGGLACFTDARARPHLRSAELGKTRKRRSYTQSASLGFGVKFSDVAAVVYGVQ